jgi:hypothetical protein
MMSNQTAGRVELSGVAAAGVSRNWHAPGYAFDCDASDDYADVQHDAEVDAVRCRRKLRPPRRLDENRRKSFIVKRYAD